MNGPADTGLPATATACNGIYVVHAMLVSAVLLWCIMQGKLWMCLLRQNALDRTATCVALAVTRLWAVC